MKAMNGCKINVKFNSPNVY